MEYNKNFNLDKLRRAAGLGKTKAGEPIGVKYQSWLKYVSGETEIPEPVNKLVHLMYWKELNIPREDIIKELRLNEVSPVSNEPPAGYEPQTEAERYYYDKWQEVEHRAGIYSDTIEFLRDKIRKLEGK